MAESCRDDCEHFEDSAESFDEGPPFNSAELENYDNDTEVRIEVLNEDDYDREKFDTKEKIDRKRKMHTHRIELKTADKAASVAARGKV